MSSTPASATSCSLMRRSSNTTKQNYKIVLAAIAAIFAAATIIIAVSAILSPAEINFSIINYKYNRTSTGVGLDLTLSANNTSHRAGVEYDSKTTLAYLQYTTSEMQKISVKDISIPKSLQPPARIIQINVSALIPPDIWNETFAGRNGTSHATTPIKLSLIVHVRFKVGPAYTLLHIIRVLCDPKDYFSSTDEIDHRLSSPVNCSAAGSI